jgi:hypothetical protein
MIQRKWKSLLLACMIASLTIIAASAAPKPGGTSSTNTNVTTTVYDHDAAGTQLLTRSDDYNGSGQATYVTNCPNSVTNCMDSILGAEGAWRLDLYNQTVRKVCLTPNDAINSSQPLGPPTECTWQNIEVYSKCFDASGNIVSYPNIVTSSNNCSFGIDFYEPATSTKYKLLSSPILPAATCPSSGCPATGSTTVVCNALNSSNQCVNWSIAPNTTAANAGVANLYKYGRAGALVFIGQYYNTYRVGLTNP